MNKPCSFSRAVLSGDVATPWGEQMPWGTTETGFLVFFSMTPCTMSEEGWACQLAGWNGDTQVLLPVLLLVSSRQDPESTGVPVFAGEDRLGTMGCWTCLWWKAAALHRVHCGHSLFVTWSQVSASFLADGTSWTRAWFLGMYSSHTITWWIFSRHLGFFWLIYNFKIWSRKWMIWRIFSEWLSPIFWLSANYPEVFGFVIFRCLTYKNNTKKNKVTFLWQTSYCFTSFGFTFFKFSFYQEDRLDQATCLEDTCRKASVLWPARLH